MGLITLHWLPAYFDKWHVPYDLEPGWETRGHASGGFDTFRGVVVHHTASNPSTLLANTVHYTLTGPDHPIANGGVSRDRDGPKIVLWAGLAANHAGTGGPILTSRGVVAKDAANRQMFGMEAENNGVGEPWADDMLDLYVSAVVAILDWASECTPGAPLGAGDVVAHREWTPGRKIDPAGPSRFATPGSNVWNMDLFRGEVFAAMLAGSDPAPLPPPPDPCGQPQTCGRGDSGPVVVELQTLLAADGWYPYTVDGSYGPRTEAGVRQLQTFLAGEGVDPGPIDGQYNDETRAALCAYAGTPV